MTQQTDEDRLRAALSNLSSYALHPSASGPVTIVETHISIVALVGDLVFKAKKPRKLPFLDFSTRELRRAVCLEEVRLNRRLCPHVYLGTAALRRERDGALRFSAIDAPTSLDDFECAVVMRRLPQERMLDRLLADGAVTRDQIEQLARSIARFHARAERGESTRRHGDPSHLMALAAANFDELAGIQASSHHPNSPATASEHEHDSASMQRASLDTSSPAGNAATTAPFAPRQLLLALRDAQWRGFLRIESALRSRAERGFVVDGHGDLHARNICMTDPPAIYDCLEFDAGLRCADTATDLAFLAMDLRHRRAPELCRALVAAYIEESGDRELPSLLPTLVAYRAIVRAKVTALAASDPALVATDRLRATDSSTRHLLLAAMASLESTSLETKASTWLVLCGPPGSGKSTLATTLATACGASLVSTDAVRKHLAGVAPSERLPASCYTPEASANTYRQVLDDARCATRNGVASVVLDGNFHSPELRGLAVAAAIAASARVLFIHVDVPPTTGLARVTARMADPARASDADPTLHDALRARFVAPTPDEPIASVRVDGAAPPLHVAAATLTAALLRDSERGQGS